MYNIKAVCSILFLISMMAYIIFIILYGINISNELRIDINKLDKYIKDNNQCNVINATVLSLYGYSCSKPECGDCINNCESPDIIRKIQYKCILVSIYNENKMVYKVSMDGCFANILFEKITVNINPFDIFIYNLLLVVGIILLLLFIILYLYKICKNDKYISI